MSEKITRGEFLKKMFGKAAEEVGKAVDRKVASMVPKGIRPPWSLNETLFLSTCEKCGGCGEICPEGIIYYFNSRAGIAAQTPYLEFKDSYCTFCGECVKVCPSGALNFENGIKDLGLARISSNRCSPAHEAGCSYCLDNCPEGAIVMSDEGFARVVESDCNGCGACVVGCKGEAIRISK